MAVELQVRRFCCCQPACPKATFVEHVPGLTFRHGRRSQGLQASLLRVALMLAGRTGARPAEALAAPVSRSTSLRLIRAVPESASATPRVPGIDEFALRKGHVYATVPVDIETRRVVDLLPDRTIETVSAWLAPHPGVEVIRRDRSAPSGEAGRLGAPAAIHVADRYRLRKNPRRGRREDRGPAPGPATRARTGARARSTASRAVAAGARCGEEHRTSGGPSP